jgi:hypothetical protein
MATVVSRRQPTEWLYLKYSIVLMKMFRLKPAGQFVEQYKRLLTPSNVIDNFFSSFLIFHP